MAELTQLETKLAEVIGLAQAAQGATFRTRECALRLAREEDANETE